MLDVQRDRVVGGGGQFQLWQPGEWLAWPVHEIHRTRADGATIEFLFNEAVGQVWHFQRDPRISQQLSRVGRTTADGLPFLAPEVVLLYKAHEDRASDWAEFATVRVALDDEQRRWLAEALRNAFWEACLDRGATDRGLTGPIRGIMGTAVLDG